VWQTVEQACEASISVEREWKPKRKASAVYRKFHPEFRRLYRSLRKDFDIITKKVSQLTA
jgi:hypothetical protein